MLCMVAFMLVCYFINSLNSKSVDNGILQSINKDPLQLSEKSLGL